VTCFAPGSCIIGCEESERRLVLRIGIDQWGRRAGDAPGGKGSGADGFFRG